MNFIPFAQNFPIPNYRVLPNMQPMIGFYNQEFIRVISLALNKSLVSYQNCYKQPQTQQSSQISKNHQKRLEKNSHVEIIEILSDEQQLVGNSLIEKTEKKIVNEKITINMSPIGEKQSPLLTQATSSEQKSLDIAKIQVQNREKNKKKAHKIQKKMEEQYQVIIPEIDEIETAYLPNSGLSVNKIQGIREKLLDRQVFQWVEKHKNRKERRQIRNLGN